LEDMADRVQAEGVRLESLEGAFDGMKSAL
jgi:hypothetical protein